MITLSTASAHALPLPDGAVHCVVTSPPYFSLRVYDGQQQIEWPAVSYRPMPGQQTRTIPPMTSALGLEPTPEAYIAHLVLCFREIRRVLRDDGVCWAIMGDSFTSGGRQGHGTRMGYKQQTNRGMSGQDDPIRSDAGLDDGNLLMVPHRLALALQGDGWTCRNDVVWAKKSPMPESVSGWNWTQHRIKVKNLRGEKTQSFATGSGRNDGNNPGGGIDQKPWAEYKDCPGCPKCSPSGYVLRRGSWRHTRSHEFIFQLVKSMGYFADQEKVRETHTMTPQARLTQRNSQRDKAMIEMGRTDKVNPYQLRSGPAIEGNPAGRNPRSVLTPRPESYPGAHYACVDTETECLTIGGWKRYDQLHSGMPIFTYNMNTQSLEIQPIQNIAMYEYKGELISIFGRNTNMMMTPNHRCVMMRRHKKGGFHPPSFVRADSLKTNMVFPVAALLPDSHLIQPTDTPQFFELLGWIVTDGHFDDSGAVTIAQSTTKPKHVERLDELARLFGNDMKRKDEKHRPMVAYTIHRELRKRVRLFLPDKSCIPEHFLMLPHAHLTAFLAGIVGGDGHIRHDKRISIAQKYQGMLDMVQAMFLRTGRSCILSQRASKRWTAFVSNKTTRYIKNVSSSLVRDDYTYHGIVWCPSVLNGTWIARRGGRPFITGNTFPTSLIAPLIRASCPAKCCPECGAAYAPVVEREPGFQARAYDGNMPHHHNRSGKALDSDYRGVGCYRGQTLGYRPTCDCQCKHCATGTLTDDRPWFGGNCPYCNESGEPIPIPGTVLDPYCGSGTTLAVARGLGLNAIGLDLSPAYLDEHSKVRIGRTPARALEELPLFKEGI